MCGDTPLDETRQIKHCKNCSCPPNVVLVAIPADNLKHLVKRNKVFTHKVSRLVTLC